MNQAKGGGMKVPVSMPSKQPSKEEMREMLKQHPDFAKLKIEKLNKCVFPKDEIPANFKEWLLVSLSQMSLAAINVPLPIYFKFVNNAPETFKFGELQKAVDIIWNSKPHVVDNTVNLNDYHVQMCAINRMRTTFEDIICPINEQVLDELTMIVAPSIIKQ